MKKEDILSLIRLILAPVLVILLGLVLIFNPDSASALISRILGWILICIAVGIGLSAVFKEPGFIGVLLVIDGLQDIANLRKAGRRFLMPLIATAVGVILVVMPMATSRLVFTCCGIVVLIIGVAMLLERLKGKKRLDSPKNDIIDAPQ